MNMLDRLPVFFTVGEACCRLGMTRHQFDRLLREWKAAGLVGIGTRAKRNGRIRWWKYPVRPVQTESDQEYLARVGREAIEGEGQ